MSGEPPNTPPPDDALKSSWEALVRHVPGIVYQFRFWPATGKSCFPYISEKVRDLYGISPGEILHDATPALRCIHPDDATRVWMSVLASAESLQPWYCEYRIIRPDGRTEWIESNSTPRREPDGSILWHGYLRSITERKERELQLQLFIEAFQSAEEAVSISDASGVIQHVNRAFTSLTGYSPAEVTGQTSRVLKSGVQSTEFYRTLWDTLLSGKVWRGDLINRRKDGSTYCAAVTISPIIDPGGHCSGFIEVQRDVTERRRAQAEIAGQRAHLAAFIEHAPAAIAMFDRDMRYIAVSQRWIDDFHLQGRELIGHSHYEIFPDLSPLVIETHQRCLRGASEHNDDDIWTPPGSPHEEHARWECLPWYTQDMEIGGIVLLTENITARVMAGQALRDSETRLRDSQRQLQSLMDSAIGVAIIATDSRGIITFYSPGAEAMFGFTADEIIGRSGPELLIGTHGVIQFAEAPPGSATRHQRRFHELIRTARAEGSDRAELSILCKDGSLKPIDITITSIRDEHGAVTGFLGTAIDITVRKAMEEELRAATQHAERSARVKTEFLANMSHEIRTPLNAIIGMSEILGELPLGEREREYIDTIRTSSETLLSLISDILDFSKIESGQMEMEHIPVDLASAIEDALDLVAPQAGRKDIDLLYFIDPDVPPVILGDSARLRQVLVNLTNNAVKFTDHGEVFVSLHRDPHSDGDRLRVSVRDTGIGIPSNRLDRLFQSFSQVDASTTRRYGGTGLGLAICHRLVTLMDGRIWADSSPGHGSDFQFEIPLRVPAAAPAALPADTTPDLAGLHALIIDANSHRSGILLTSLTSWHAQTRATGDPAAALAWLREGETFGLAILDARLPSVSDYTLIRQLRAIPSASALPILILTAIGHHLPQPPSDLDFLSTLPSRPLKLAALHQALVDIHTTGALAAHPAPLEPRPIATDCPLRILIAEDNLVNQRVITLLLERLGYHPELVGNGLEVLDITSRIAFDVILLDIQMPGMDGLQAARELRRRHPVQPLDLRPWIIALTADAIDGDREQCLAAGMNDYLSKPVRLDQLASALRHACHAIGCC